LEVPSEQFILSFTMDELRTVPYFLKVVFADLKIDYLTSLNSLVETADKARREGLLSLESQLTEIDNPFLVRGLQLVIDGTDPELTRNMLEMEIEAYETKEKGRLRYIHVSRRICSYYGYYRYCYGTGTRFK